jgi:hypothetical protein
MTYQQKLDRIIEDFQDLDTVDFMDFSERDLVDAEQKKCDRELQEEKRERGELI